jgi:hypothetical protein
MDEKTIKILDIENDYRLVQKKVKAQCVAMAAKECALDCDVLLEDDPGGEDAEILNLAEKMEKAAMRAMLEFMRRIRAH